MKRQGIYNVNILDNGIRHRITSHFYELGILRYIHINKRVRCRYGETFWAWEGGFYFFLILYKMYEPPMNKTSEPPTIDKDENTNDPKSIEATP